MTYCICFSRQAALSILTWNSSMKFKLSFKKFKACKSVAKIFHVLICDVDCGEHLS